MPAPVYATEAQLAASEYLPSTVTAPTGDAATRLLTRASRKVDSLLFNAVYDVDADDQPTDDDVAQALQDAACATAAWWLETGDESGTAARYTSTSIGSVSLGGLVNPGKTDPTVAPSAVEVLTNAGLLAQGPILWG